MLDTLIGGRYKIIRLLGSGGFGRTYLAQDIQQSEPFYCVIKHFQPISQDERTLSVARRLFETEARILERLGQHEQIPRLIDFFEENQEFYIIEDFVDGHALSDEFSRDNCLDEGQVIEFLRDVLQILAFVHESRVIHRDIKPGNLIRRPDGQIVLIDFGAVKELGTQLLGGEKSGNTQFTVGICTHGYTPGEQLAGSPRFSSDIYALGMTAIQALTGQQPTELPVDPDTSQILWKDVVRVSPGLSLILDRMVRYEFRTRFQSATDVLRALDKLSELPTNITEVPPSMLLPESMLRLPLNADARPGPGWRGQLRSGFGVAIAASVAIASGVIGLQSLGWLEPLELSAYDHMVRLKPSLDPDPRLLIVQITEADLQRLQRVTPSDATLSDVLSTLQEYSPRVIGLDLYRDIPQDPGRDLLLEQLQADNVIAITKMGDVAGGHIPAPPGVPDERIGFNDFPIDADGIVRRNLIFASYESQVLHSFATRVALLYLKEDGIVPVNGENNLEQLNIGQSRLIPLESYSGGYQSVDAAGYQILLRYRSPHHLAQTITVSDILDGNFEPDWIRDRIVLIGTTAPSARDLFDTPYTASLKEDHQMAGVIIHAQMVSQLLTAATDGNALYWFFPAKAEMAWILLWALVGGGLTWYVRHPLSLGLSSASVLVIIVGTSILLFINQGWLPVVAPVLAFVITGSVIVSYRFYRLHRYQQAIETMMWTE
ncbi:CHASE2 domain-containing protein [Leptolyngbya sp. CCY15150]|uniref:CHASE2 domain-containing protein n=1 Tax=Leptolyngbya sp. CCY15150 TaxID=2767772 RepID=UPI00195180D0|nr:CHASE2 domain-containing protein [Leptolyngbya sp. CCY15150]